MPVCVTSLQSINHKQASDQDGGGEWIGSANLLEFALVCEAVEFISQIATMGISYKEAIELILVHANVFGGT